MIKTSILSSSIALGLILSPGIFANINNAEQSSAGQILVTIDDSKITRGELRKALTSSPFYTQFNTLNENVQASIRGDLLKRMVASRLLAAEAKRLKLDQTQSFKDDLNNYTDGLLYRQYTNALKHAVKLTDAELKQLRARYKDNHDAYAAAKSAEKSKKYKALLKLTLLKLRDSLHVKLHEERINPQMTPDTILMEGDEGLSIRASDLFDASQMTPPPEKDAVQEKLYQQIEFLLILNAAKKERLDISKQLERYKEQLLPTLLSKKKARQWLGDKEQSEKALRDYYDSHPEISRVGDQWHIGQIVLANREQAEKAKDLIKSGKASLFQLAGKMSIDPYGKAHNGDMGWIAQGSGQASIEKALKTLKDNELSEIIETPMGFHLITILKRKPGKTVNFESIRDKIRQRVISEKMKTYLQELQKKHDINWLVMEKDQTKASKLLKNKTDGD